MKITKNDVKYFSTHILIVCCIVGLLACNHEEPITNNDKRIIFHIEITSLATTDVTFCITHNGSNRDTYYGILTADSIADKIAYVNDYIQNVGSTNILKNAWNQRKRIETFHSLEPYTTYHFLVFAIDNNTACVTAEPTSVDIQTTSSVEFTINPNWQIEWGGEALYGNEYRTKVKCNVTDESSTELFYPFLISEDIFQNDSSIDKIIYLLLDDAKNNMEEGEVWLSNSLLSRTSVNLYSYKNPGYYYALMVGVTEDGSPTGHYAISEKQYIAEYTMLDEYKSLIGSWNLADAEGRKNLIQITKGRVNKTLSIINWTNRSWPVTIRYNPNNDMRFIMNTQQVADDVHITSGAYTYISNVYLYGWYIGDNGNSYRSTKETLTMINKMDDTHYTITNAFYYSKINGSTCGCRYYSYNPYKGQYEILNNSTYTFPISLTRIE